MNGLRNWRRKIRTRPGALGAGSRFGPVSARRRAASWLVRPSRAVGSVVPASVISAAMRP